MIVKAIKIKPEIEEKIEIKHAITITEIEDVILKNNPKFRKVKDCYMAIGIWKRHLTIFFSYNTNFKEATIITAYPSSKWQIKLYRRSK